MKMFIAGDIQETDLIGKCKNGDTRAFGLLMHQYRRRLYGYLLKTTKNNNAAEDLLQETLIKVWRGMGKYEEKTRFSSWLFTIAHNVCVDHFRKSKTSSCESLNEEYSNAAVDSDPLSRLELNEDKKALLKGIEELPEKQKRVLLLRIYSGLTFKEISGITDEPVNTVLSHMYYAVRKMKKIMKVENGE
jgi:RNA polymerase sigma-70 factor (ECF subfamily)